MTTIPVATLANLDTLVLAAIEQRAARRPRRHAALVIRSALDRLASVSDADIDVALAEITRLGGGQRAAIAAEALIADRAVDPSGTRVMVARLVTAAPTPSATAQVERMTSPPRGATVTWCPWRWNPIQVLGWSLAARAHWRDHLLCETATAWPRPDVPVPENRWGLQIGVLVCTEGLRTTDGGCRAREYQGWDTPSPEDPRRAIDCTWDAALWSAARHHDREAATSSGLRITATELLQTAARRALCANVHDMVSEAINRPNQPSLLLDAVLWDSDPDQPSVLHTRWLHTATSPSAGDPQRLTVELKILIPQAAISHETVVQDLQRMLDDLSDPNQGTPPVLWGDREKVFPAAPQQASQEPAAPSARRLH